MGLAKVAYDYASESSAQALALYNAANETYAEDPAATSKCYSADADKAYAPSAWAIASADASAGVDGLVKDLVSARALDGDSWSKDHLLSPFTTKVSFGRVDVPQDGWVASYVVITPVNGTVTLSKDFVAFPGVDTPLEYFIGINSGGAPSGSTRERFVFAALASKTTPAASAKSSAIDYSTAVVTVTDVVSKKALAVSDLKPRFYNSFIDGLPNSLSFRVAGLSVNRDYTVKVSGVKVNGVARSYEYPVSLLGKQ